MNFIGEKTYNTETYDIILYIKQLCDNIPVGNRERKFENCFDTHKTNTANLEM